MKLLIKNGKVINSFNETIITDIYIENDQIVEMGVGLDTKDANTLDVTGCFIMPGLIDMHCNVCDPGFEHKEDVLSASRAAIRGGYTSITCLPSTNPVIDNKTVVKYVIDKSLKESLVNTLPYGSATKGCLGVEMSEIGKMVSAGIVALSDGDVPVNDAKLMENILLHSSMFNLPVIVYCCDMSLAGNGVMNKGVISTQMGLKGISRQSEEVAVARNILLTKYTGARLHITKVSTKGSVDIIREAKKGGINVTCDTCPQYFTLTEEATEGYNTLAKINPPLRTKDDVDAIIEGLKDGTIDAISTGHSPEFKESKKSTFDSASFGISMLDSAFVISYETLVKTNILSIGELTEKMSAGPARILNLKHKGKLEIGCDADMLIFKDNERCTIDSSKFASKAKFSLYEGKEITTCIQFTIAGGNIYTWEN